jgi:hypothetical protein
LLQDESLEVLACEEIDVPLEDLDDQPLGDKRSPLEVWVEGWIESWGFCGASWICSVSMDVRIGASHTDSLVLVMGGSNWICSASKSVRIGASIADSILLVAGGGNWIRSAPAFVRVGVSIADSLILVVGGGDWIWIVWRKAVNKA